MTVETRPETLGDGSTADVIRFGSVLEAVRAAREGVARRESNAAAVALHRRNAESGRHYGDRDWYRDHLDQDWSLPKAVQAFQRGEGISLGASVRSLAASLPESATGGSRRVRKIRRHLEAGETMDPLGWLHRRPDCWSEVCRETRPAPLVRVAVLTGANCHRKGRHTRWRLTAAAALVEALAATGRAVEVDGVWATTRSYPSQPSARWACIWRVKAADAPAQAASIGLGLSLPFTRLLFAVMPISAPRKVAEDLGTSERTNSPRWLAGMYDVIVPDLSNQHDVEDWLRQQGHALAWEG